jgi:HTH-type transcriptional regulator / antitoxin HigA
MLVITMTETQTNQYRPSTVTPPGATLADLIEERDIKQAELATRMGVTPKFINELVAGKASITPTTALALERALDVPADFWLARDARFQEYVARKHSQSELAAHTGWLNELPLKDMRDFGWIRECSSNVDYVAECLQYFGVASVDAWRAQYVERILSLAAYRMSKSTNSAQGAIAAWLRQGELEAAKLDCQPFDRTKLLAAIETARPLTCEHQPSVFVPKLVQLFLQLGIAVAFVRSPKGCPVSGAVRWLSPKKALIQLSFRYMRNDSLWFTFLHECGHIYLHGKKMMFLEGGEISNAEEDEADKFAADKLIPSQEWAQFRSGTYTEAAINPFAKSLGIHPGIVLGRLQNEKLVPWNRLNHLKVRYSWKDSE